MTDSIDFNCIEALWLLCCALPVNIHLPLWIAACLASSHGISPSCLHKKVGRVTFMLSKRCVFFCRSATICKLIDPVLLLLEHPFPNYSIRDTQSVLKKS